MIVQKKGVSSYKHLLPPYFPLLEAHSKELCLLLPDPALNQQTQELSFLLQYILEDYKQQTTNNQIDMLELITNHKNMVKSYSTKGNTL
jgi:hypothetical protein